eukprot:TRINITY_DN19351_c0_g1_i1.p1 TRINITY_DN19351_c0_g1~~TRINITY_DN19351_c0_g1_i1.p1  ORF type:complete len:160 (-),score=27.70 TRINITY_DN19351_c0_g1_i1:140-619(-)
MSKKKNVLTVIFIILCALLFLFSAWYWYYLYVAVGRGDTAAIVIYIISALLLIIMAFIGILSALRMFKTVIIYFAIVMLVMFILGVVQLCVVIYSSTACNSEDNPFTFICNLDPKNAGVAYWIPTGLILLLNLLCAIFSLVLRSTWEPKEEKGGPKNYY